MNAATIIAYAYRADIYCEDCIGDVEDDGELDSDLRPQPVFCGEEVDSAQRCGECGCEIDGFSVLNEEPAAEAEEPEPRRYIVTRPVYCSTIVVADTAADALAIALRRPLDEFEREDPQPSPDLGDWLAETLEE